MAFSHFRYLIMHGLVGTVVDVVSTYSWQASELSALRLRVSELSSSRDHMSNILFNTKQMKIEALVSPRTLGNIPYQKK